MADGTRPSSNPTNPTLKQSFPSIKPPLIKPPPRQFTSYNPPSQRRRGFCHTLFSGCCCLFLWLIVSIFALLLIAAMASGIFYALYRPKLPHVYVSSISVSSFNITSSNKLTSSFNFTVTVKNRNDKIGLFYNKVMAHCYTNNIEIGSGSFPAFMLEPNKFATVTTALGFDSVGIEPMAAMDLKNKRKFPARIQLDTEAGVKIGKVKTPMVGIGMSCGGFHLVLPRKKMNASRVDNIDCVIKLRIKILDWTFG